MFHSFYVFIQANIQYNESILQLINITLTINYTNLITLTLYKIIVQ